MPNYRQLEKIKSANDGQRFVAVFHNTKTAQTKSQRFGNMGSSTFIDHTDEDKKKRNYIARQKENLWCPKLRVGLMGIWKSGRGKQSSKTIPSSEPEAIFKLLSQHPHPSAMNLAKKCNETNDQNHARMCQHFSSLF